MTFKWFKKKKNKKGQNCPKKEKVSKEVETSSETKKQPTNIYYLTTRVEDGKKVGWEIKRGNASKVSAICKTKEEAKTKVKEFAKNSEATVIIYKMDGSIDETYKIENNKK